MTPRASARYVVSGDPDCDHADARVIGYDGGTNRYYRCPDCGAALLEEGGPSPAGGTDDLGTVDPRMGDLLEDIDAHREAGGSSLHPESWAPPDRLLDAWRRLRP